MPANADFNELVISCRRYLTIGRSQSRCRTELAAPTQTISNHGGDAASDFTLAQ